MRVGTQTGADELSEVQFLTRLQDSTQKYLESVDAWEAQYQKYYRVSSPGPHRVSGDLESVQRGYLTARQDFQECVPRARRLCLKYGLRDPWQAMLHIALGAETPQAGAKTAIGRAERTLIAKCLTDLQAASCGHAEPPTEDPASRPRGFLRRLHDYLF
jgi:hypothetical protein